jgi:hypothetical protein
VWKHLYVSDRFGTLQKQKYFRPKFVPKLSKKNYHCSSMTVSHRFRTELVKKLILSEIRLKHVDGFGTKHWNLFMWLYKAWLFLYTLPFSFRAHSFSPSLLYFHFLSLTHSKYENGDSLFFAPSNKQELGFCFLKPIVLLFEGRGIFRNLLFLSSTLLVLLQLGFSLFNRYRKNPQISTPHFWIFQVQNACIVKTPKSQFFCHEKAHIFRF